MPFVFKNSRHRSIFFNSSHVWGLSCMVCVSLMVPPVMTNTFFSNRMAYTLNQLACLSLFQLRAFSLVNSIVFQIVPKKSSK